MKALYPWFVPIWQKWCSNLQADRLSAANLIIAQSGMGIDTLLTSMATSLLCTISSTDPCGVCHSCSLMSSHSHPDCHYIEPEKSGKAITVEVIRQANRWAQESSQLGGFRVIVISPADAMNDSAANALLKTLEEPSKNCFFILAANDGHRLLATIISRCRQFFIPAPTSHILQCWLTTQTDKHIPSFAAHLNGNSPMATLEFLQSEQIKQYLTLEKKFTTLLSGHEFDIKGCVELINDSPLLKLTWLWYLLSDTQRAHMNIASSDALPGSENLVEWLSYDVAYRQMGKLQQLIQQLQQFSGLNSELLITQWLIDFEEVICS
jgi:DNA polymerase III subunit delta'